MNWYGGNIAEAVQRSKQEGAVFFVAIFGEDESSKKLEESVTSGDIQTLLSTSGRYVCIRLKADSQEHQQFKQIYSNAQSPCLYFISQMGAPVAVVHGEMSAAALKAVCESAWSKHSVVVKSQKAPEQSANQASQQPAASAASAAPEVPGASGDIPGAGSVENVRSQSIEELQNEMSNPNLTLEQKIERARQLAAAKAKLKLEEEAEEARRREKERREAGKGVAELKRWQDEQEAKKIVEDRKREKKEDELLRQRIKEQIAQDRAERNKRTNASIVYDSSDPVASTSTAASANKPTVTSNAPINYAGKARLQFRMPDGSSQSHTFEQEVTLGHVRDYLISGNHVTFSSFSLCVAYPRREFTSVEYEKSLRDLGLLPSAALLVIPATGRFMGPGTGAGGAAGLWAWLTTLLGYLLYPVTFLFGVIQNNLALTSTSEESSQSPPTSARPIPPRAENRLGGGGAGPSSQRQPDPSPSSSASKDIRKRNVDSKSKPEGNVHRLRNQEADSDDELGTWNGNSTQQKPR